MQQKHAKNKLETRITKAENKYYKTTNTYQRKKTKRFQIHARNKIKT